MNLNYIYHEGSQENMPKELDTESSKTIIYLRKNIRRVTHTDSMTGKTYELWGYDEAQLTPEEYLIYQVEKTKVDLDYVSAMVDVEL